MLYWPQVQNLHTYGLVMPCLNIWDIQQLPKLLYNVDTFISPLQIPSTSERLGTLSILNTSLPNRIRLRKSRVSRKRASKNKKRRLGKGTISLKRGNMSSYVEDKDSEWWIIKYCNGCININIHWNVTLSTKCWCISWYIFYISVQL